jgi:DNA polymerase-3 subunit delta
MKLSFRDIEPFLKTMNPAVRAVLVYGPDSGLVQERAAILGRQVVADLNDPFNVAHLTGSIISEDPARFSDEANAQSLMGGRRLVRISSASNDITPALKTWLKGSPDSGCVVVIEGGDLRPKDALRKLCEELPNAAALPCYVEDERNIATLVRDTLRERGLAIQSDASAWFAASIKGDRMRVRMELEKLILYMDGYNSDAAQKAQQKTVTLEDVKNSSGDAGIQSIDDLIYAFAGRNPQQSLQSFSRLTAEGVATIAIIRSLQNHILRLHSVKSLMETHGQGLEEAMKTLQPPVFFKQADQFAAQLRLYSLTRLRTMLIELNDLEAKTKQSGVPADTLIGHFLLHAANAD